jgi:hypothetical protein
MASEKIICSDTALAGADLTGKQFFLAKFSSGKLILATAGTVAFPVLEPATLNNPVTYGIAGKSKVQYGGTVTAGDKLASDANGKAVTATTGQSVVGIALVSGVSGDIGSMAVPGSGLA